MTCPDGEKYSLRPGETLDLGQGYCLEVKEVDVDGQMIWLGFTKDGEYVDDEIIKVGNNNGGTWDVNLDNIQGVSNIVVLRVHVSQVFQGAVDRIAQIDGIWLIDYANVINLKAGDQFGEFTLTEIISGVDESNPGYLVFESSDTQSN